MPHKERVTADCGLYLELCREIVGYRKSERMTQWLAVRVPWHAVRMRYRQALRQFNMRADVMQRKVP